MIIVPMSTGGGGSNHSGAELAGLLIGIFVGMPLWAFIFALIGEVTGVDIDFLYHRWWGLPAFLGLATLFVGLVLVTSLVVGEICDRIARKKGSHAR